MTSDAAWREAPWPALMVATRGASDADVQANTAACAWAVGQGLAQQDLQRAVADMAAALRIGAAGAAAMPAATTAAAPVPNSSQPCSALLGALRLQATAVPLGDGRTLFWLQGTTPSSAVVPSHAEAADPHNRTATEFLDRALALAEVVVWRTDLARQRVHYNAVGFQALGLAQSPDGISVEMLRARTHPDDVHKVERANEQAAASTESVDAVARFRFADQSWRPQLTRRVALRDERGQLLGFSGIAIDVSELQREREQVQRLHEHTALAAQALGVGFWSSQADREGRYTLVGDEQLHRIYASAPGQIAKDQDQWLRDFVHPDDQEWVGQRLRLADERLEPLLDLRCRIINGQGQERWLQSWTHRTVLQGRRATFGMELDVTDSQRALQEQQRQQQREQFAIDAAGVGIWERDLHGHVLYWNDAMYRQRGCTPDDARHPDDIMDETTAAEDRLAVKSTYLQHIASGQAYRKELRLRLPDGSPRWILSHGRPVRNAQGQVVSMAGINLDVTERKNAALLEAEKERVEKASREKSAFMARMSHELRTPMNAVLGFSQLMRDDTAQALTPVQLKRLGLIEDAGHHLLRLINDLLEIAGRSNTAAPPAASPIAPSSPVPEIPSAAAPADPSTAPSRHLQVLCVEDNPVNLLLVREVLALRPLVHLRCAENGLSGVAAALQHPPDLLLLDLQLPDISGHEVLRQLREQATLANCRFVALSADAMPESITSALAEGFDDYWTKPIQFDRFLAHIDLLVARLQGQSQGQAQGQSPAR